jgi:hypothetical protein
MVSRRSNKTTGLSLIVAHWKTNFLALCACYKLLTRHYCMAHMTLLDITQSRAMCILVVILCPRGGYCECGIGYNSTRIDIALNLEQHCYAITLYCH